MKTIQSAPTRIERSAGHKVGINVGSAISSTPDVVIVYKAARNPLLIQARKASNESVIASLTAELLADLQG